MSEALVVFSGGQDSTTCLGWAKNRYDQVRAVSFLYGQNHSIEIEQAKVICAELQIPQKIIDVSFFGNLVHSALTSSGDVNQPHGNKPDLPASFVPNRNAFFLTLAHSYAQTLQINCIIVGTCQTDYSGYPDCREKFIQSIQHALNLGAETKLEIHTPLMHLTKAQTFFMAEQEGVLDLVLQYSHTCYKGSSKKNSWGRGCGNCPACELREKGYHEFLNKHKSLK